MKLNFFKPKAAKTDFTQNMLPQNRKQVFFDVVKLHFKELLLLGFVLLLFSLPLLFSQVVQDSFTSAVVEQLPQSPTDDEILAARDSIAATENFRAFVNVIFLMIYSVVFSGVIRVVRQYAWEQNVHVRTEFFKGVKQNVGQNLLTSFLGGLIYALCVGIANFAMLSSGWVSYLFFLPIYISVLIVFPVLSYTVTAICVYSNTWRQNLKIGFVVFFKAPFKTLLALICCIAIFIPQFISNFYCHIFGRIISALLTPFALLGWLLFSFNQFDKFVNKHYYPSIVAKGTFGAVRTETIKDEKSVVIADESNSTEPTDKN